MSIQGAQQRITGVLLSWEGVSSHPHRFGGVEYRLGRRELGHIHGDALVDIPFPRRVRDEVVAAGFARAHHILPDSGWVSLPIQNQADVSTAIKLLQRSYDLAKAQRARRQEFSQPTRLSESQK